MLLTGQIALVTGGGRESAGPVCENSLRKGGGRALSPGQVPKTRKSQEIQAALGKCYRVEKGKFFRRSLNGILQGRPQTVVEIAHAALFLVSDQSSSITGQTPNVDGGMAFY